MISKSVFELIIRLIIEVGRRPPIFGDSTIFRREVIFYIQKHTWIPFSTRNTHLYQNSDSAAKKLKKVSSGAEQNGKT